MNLFLHDPTKGLMHCKHIPFIREEELESFIFDNPDLLGDVYPLWRQVRGGAKPGIPDIIGIDRSGAVCIVEVKNISVDESILPQVLAYAIWAENNPDSIAKMWLERKDRPEELSPDFENYSVRIIVVAPSIQRGTAHHMKKVSFPVDLLEVNRYQLEGQFVVAANRIDAPSQIKPKLTSGIGNYDHSWYISAGYDPTAVEAFFGAVEQASKIAKRSSWPVEAKFNKEYVSFKIGGSIAFGVQWASKREFAVFFKLSPDDCDRLAPKNSGRYRYDSGWKQGMYRLETGKATILDYERLMAACVSRIVGL